MACKITHGTPAFIAHHEADGAAGPRQTAIPDGFAQGLGDQGSRVEVLLGPDAGLTGDVLAGLVTSTVQRMDADAAAIAGAGSGGLLPPDRLGALAAELDAKRAIDRGSRLAAEI